ERRQRFGEAARPARVQRAEAALPREDGCERRLDAASLLQRGRRLRRLRQRDVRSLFVSRMRALVLAFVAALALPALAAGGVSLRGVDTSAYPTVRATV